VLDRTLAQLLAVSGVRTALGVPGARGVPAAAPSTTRPSVRDRVRIANDRTELGIKRYQLGAP
jgi:hypothetical protein